MATLKAETSDLHEAIERRMDLGRMTGSLAGYRQTLRAFYGLYEPIEASLASAPPSGFRFVPEPKTPRLAADLKALGESEIDRLPRCPDLPPVDSVPRLVGTLYVLEGASLGGQIISRLLRERLGITSEAGGRFFHGSGERTGERWRDFRRAADSALRMSNEIDEAVVAARETFTAFDQWLADHETLNSQDVA